MLHNSSNIKDHASGQRNLIPETSVIMGKPSTESSSRKPDMKTGGDEAHPKPSYRRSILSPTAAPFFPSRGLAVGDTSGSHAVLAGPNGDRPALGPLPGPLITSSDHLVPVGQSRISMAAEKHARSLSGTADLTNALHPRLAIVATPAERHVRFASRTSLGEPINEGRLSASFRTRLLWHKTMNRVLHSGTRHGQLPPAVSPLQVHAHQLRQFGRPHPHQLHDSPMSPYAPPSLGDYAPPQMFPRFYLGVQSWNSANPVPATWASSQGQSYHPNFSHSQVPTPEGPQVFAPLRPIATPYVLQGPRFPNVWREIDPSNEYCFAPRSQPAREPHSPLWSPSKPPVDSLLKK